MTDPYAVDAEGRALYLVTSTSAWPSGNWERLEPADSLAEAKRHHGWTRELHHSRKVRRARQSDVDRLDPPAALVDTGEGAEP